MVLIPQIGAKCSDSIWANTIVEPPQAIERGQSWPLTTVTGQEQHLFETTPSPTKPRVAPLPHDYSSSDHCFGPQTPELQCVPWVAQNAKPPDTALTRYSLDSALAVSARFAKADQPKPPPAIPGFFTRQSQQLVQPPVFGEDYVADTVTEVFYIGEKPPRPLRDDGVIKIPDLDHPGKFQDGFKVDMTGTWILERVLRDLHADQNVVCCQRRKVTSRTAHRCIPATQMQCCTFLQSVLMALIES